MEEREKMSEVRERERQRRREKRKSFLEKAVEPFSAERWLWQQFNKFNTKNLTFDIYYYF
jgi:hypothetical protein